MTNNDLISQVSTSQKHSKSDKLVRNMGPIQGMSREITDNDLTKLVMVPIYFQNISIIAARFITSCLQTDYLEYKTQLRHLSSENFASPPQSPETMKAFSNKFYSIYNVMHDPIFHRCASLLGKNSNHSSIYKDPEIKTRAYYNLRYLLPAGTLTNIGCVASMKNLLGLIFQLKNHQNLEFNFIGLELKAALLKSYKILTKQIDQIDQIDQFKFKIPAYHSLSRFSNKFDMDNLDCYIDLCRFDKSDKKFKEQEESFKNFVKDIYGMNWDIFCLTKKHNSHIPDIFKLIDVHFDMMIDYGSYSDLQKYIRHSQFYEPLTINYGYIIPDDIKGAELENDYKSAMESIKLYGDEAVIYDINLYQYMIPLGYLHRSIFKIDLHQLFHLIKSWTKTESSPLQKKMAHEMRKLTKEIYPDLTQWCEN